MLAKGTALLCEGLKVNLGVTTLDLQTCGARCDGAKALADALVATSNLVDVRFGGNAIGNEGAMALASALPECAALVQLDLAGSDVDT